MPSCGQLKSILIPKFTYVNRLTGEEQKENPVQQLYTLSEKDMKRDKNGVAMAQLLTEAQQDPRLATPFELRSSLLASGEKKAVQKKKSFGQQNKGPNFAEQTNKILKRRSPIRLD